MSTVRRVLPAIVLAPVLAACASAQAKGPEKPALDVPPPPPHAIALQAEPLEPVAEVPGSTPAPTGTGAARPGRSSREAPPRPDTSKPAEPPKPDQPVPEAAPPAAAPPAPAPQLKTPQTADTGAVARTVRTTIDRAKNMLLSVNYGPLSNERKKAYNDAKLFLQQAEDALKEGNVVFAQAVATKGETLARELAGR